MNKSYLYLLAVGVAIIMLAGIYFSLHRENYRLYNEAIMKYRTEKNRFMTESPESPLDDRRAFKGLHYFAPDAAYKFETIIRPLEDTGIFRMRMTDKGTETFRRFAVTDFNIGGRACHLVLYKYISIDSGSTHLFVPFADLTNGNETYAGGRYLDVELKNNNAVTLDFNLAYNPFCMYNHHYVCPVPPKENRLKVRIPAGERVYKE